MRKREDILKDYIQIPKMLSLISTDKNKAGLFHNPKLLLEVLLDIRDLLEKKLT